MKLFQGTGYATESRPVWGAWIEMQSVFNLLIVISCRAPYGARGLK